MSHGPPSFFFLFIRAINNLYGICVSNSVQLHRVAARQPPGSLAERIGLCGRLVADLAQLVTEFNRQMQLPEVAPPDGADVEVRDEMLLGCEPLRSVRDMDMKVMEEQELAAQKTRERRMKTKISSETKVLGPEGKSRTSALAPPVSSGRESVDSNSAKVRLL